MEATSRRPKISVGKTKGRCGPGDTAGAKPRAAGLAWLSDLPRSGYRSSLRAETLIFIHKLISAAKLPYREAVRDDSPGLLGLGFSHKELALKARPNAMVSGHGSQGIHFHPFSSVAPSGRILMELSQA